MAQQTINVGSAANDSTGDALRTALGKVNANFDELYAAATLPLGFLSGELEFDFPSVDPGESTSITVTVTGATPGAGNVAVAGFSSILPAGCVMTAQVVSPNTVAVVLINTSGSPVNLGSGTVSAVVFTFA